MAFVEWYPFPGNKTDPYNVATTIASEYFKEGVDKELTAMPGTAATLSCFTKPIDCLTCGKCGAQGTKHTCEGSLV